MAQLGRTIPASDCSLEFDAAWHYQYGKLGLPIDLEFLGKDMKKIVFVVCMYFGVILHANAIEAPPPDSNRLLLQNLAAAQEEIRELKAQAKAVQSYQESILSTVHWSLGTLASVAALLIGFSWFANFRIYERDKAMLKEELGSAIDDEVRKVQKIIDEHISETKKSISEQIATETQGSVGELKRKIEGNAKKAARDHAVLEIKLLEAERDKWIADAVYANAVRCSRDLLEIALALDSQWRVSKALDALQSDLSVILRTKRSVPDADCIRSVIATLDKVGTEQVISTSAIKDMLAKVRAGLDV